MKSIKPRLVAFTLSIIVLSLGIVALALLVRMNSIIAEAEHNYGRRAETAFRSALDFRAQEAETLAAGLAAQPPFGDALARRDREAMAALAMPTFTATSKSTGMTQMHAHTADVHSFLRFNQPTKFGDDLRGIRPMLVEVNSKRRPMRGLEGGVFGVAIRGVVPVQDRDGNHVGSLEAGTYIDDALLSRIRTDGIDYAVWLADGKGGVKRLASTQPETAPPLLPETMESVMAGQRPEGRHTLGNTPISVIAVPLSDYSGKTVGAVQLMIDRSRFAAEQTTAVIWTIVLFMLTLLIGGLATVTMSNQITRPLQILTNSVQEISNGKLDSVIPTFTRRDEVATMAEALAVLRDNSIRARDLEQAQRTAAEARAKRHDTIDRLTRDFGVQAAETLAALAASGEQLQDAALSLTTSAENTNREVEIVTAAANQAAANVDTVASATEELTATEAHITQQVSQTSEVARLAVSDARSAGGVVSGLNEAARRVGEIVGLIRDIANQTNLLALNATIEAARAGDAGKGFAVVAGEVKALATQTARATDEIVNQVDAIQGVAEQAAAAIRVIAERIAEVDHAAATIAGAVAQQGAATQDISRNVHQAATGTADVSDSIKRVGNTAMDTFGAAEQVSTAATSLSGIASDLRQRVERFLEGIKAA